MSNNKHIVIPMRKYFLHITALLLFASCGSANWNKLIDSNGYTFIGNWEKLTNTDSLGYVIYTPEDAMNWEVKISGEDKTIYVQSGLEYYTYEIKHVAVENDMFFISVEGEDDFICSRIDADKAEWDIYGIKFTYTNNTLNYLKLGREKYNGK